MPSSQVPLNLLVLACIILFPIVPAYLLFRALPSTAIVTGPLHGFKINLGGAFAGYFSLILLILCTHNTWQFRPPAYQLWELQAQVTDETGAAIQPLDPRDVQLTPPSFRANPDGTFNLTFSTTPTPAGGGIDYPNLIVSHANFGQRTIPLDPTVLRRSPSDLHAETDEAKQRITIGRIALQKLPAYSATGQPPAPVQESSRLTPPSPQESQP
jgi:hypothetical protein